MNTIRHLIMPSAAEEIDGRNAHGPNLAVSRSTAVVLVMAAALAADPVPVIDINDFLPSDIGDWNGDGVPDQFDGRNGDGMPDIPDGIHGIWDDTVGAKTPGEFILEVDIFRQTFDFADTRSKMVGPCGGLAISCDAAGNSIDAVVNAGDDQPSVDVITGDQAFTRCSSTPRVSSPTSVSRTTSQRCLLPAPYLSWTTGNLSLRSTITAGSS